MPLYEYFCADYQAKFEALRPMSQADEKIACERCESTHTSRVLSVVFVTSSSGEPVGGLGHSCACGGACGCGYSHN
jgi:putative FmdB family regulatory protein